MPETPEQTSSPAERYNPAASDETTNAPDGAKKRRNPNEPTAVVGLGASAGGIQALQEFFGQMSTQSGLAFVVVMHLSPEHESNLAEILQTQTAMPVLQVNEAIKVERDHVYVIPPNKHLAMIDGMVTLSDPQQQTGRRIAIDLFFRTLAEQYGQRSVCIVLSGADSDGTIGLKHIKAQGGVTIAQEPAEAEYDSMPRHAIETGMVDWVLPVGEMPKRLLAYVENEKAMTLPAEKIGGDDEHEPDEHEEKAPGGPLVAKQTDDPHDETALREVLAFLRSQTGHDFSHYKRATVLRRIARRLQVNSLETIPAYLDFLRTHAHEASALLRDLLICVTHFFRDPGAFAALEAHIPQLFAGKTPNDQVRVWVPACATGEEAYSIAMLLYEQASRLERPPSIQVFATDLDDEVVRDAREGIYPATIEADVSQERLRRFFFETQGRYRIRKEVRELVLFAEHDLLRDSPFSRLDLVSCRNLLIYLKPAAQHRVLDIFHFALRPGGLLFIGGSENIDDGRYFAVLDKRQRLYARRATPRPPMVQLLPPRARGDDQPAALPRLVTPPAVSELAAAQGELPHFTPDQQRQRSLGELHLGLLEQYAPPSVIVDENYDILHLSDKAGAFLQMPAGEPSANLLKIVLEPLRLELRTVLFRAARGSETVTVPRIRLLRNQHVNFVDLHVRPSPPHAVEKFFLVIFDEKSGAGDEQTEHAAAAPEPVALHLEEELQELRSQLNVTVEQHEAAGEELKASNEELQAMNEELRSASEELETSKEELQSLNEELTTVNQELKNNLEELSRTNSDLQNLMASTDMATVFLDRELRIKRYTPRVQELFNMIPTDVGRPLSDITSKLNYPELVQDADRVLRDLTKHEREVKKRGNGWFLARLSPYRTLDHKINGVVVTFIDVTARRAAEEALRQSEEEFRRGVEEAPIPMIMQAEDGQVLQVSRTWTELTGYTIEEIPTFDAWLNKAYGAGGEDVRERMRRSFHGEAPLEQVEFDLITLSGDRRTWSFSASPIGILRDGRRFIVGMALDVTERKRAEESLRISEENYRTLFDSIDEGFCVVEMLFDEKKQPVDYRFLEVNPAFARHTGIESAAGKRIREIAPGHEQHWFDIYGQIALTGEPQRFQNQARELGERFYDVYAFRVGQPEDRKVAVLFRDISESRHTEEALRESEERFRQFAENSSDVFWILNAHTQRLEYLNPIYEKMFGETREPIMRNVERWTELIHPEDRERGADMLSRLLEGESVTVEYRIIRPNDGEIRWIRDSGFPIRDQDGMINRVAGLLQDVTADQQRTEALRESEERFRAVANLVPDLLWSTDGSGAADWFNHRWIDYTGQTVEEGAGDGWMDTLHPDDRDEVEREFRAAIAAGRPMRHEQRIRSKDGEYRWFLVQKNPLHSEGGVTRWFAAASDIHEQRIALDVVRESEERFRYLVEGAREYAIFMLDPSNIIVHWNAGAERVFGWTAEEAVGRSGRLVFTPEDKKNKQEEKEIAIAMRAGSTPDKRWHLRKDGSRIWVDGVMHRVNDPKTGALRGFAKVARDATDQRRAQEELEERVKERTAELTATNQKLQEEIQQRSRLEQEILLISEREKRRIGHDLHDSLCQQLAATAFLLETQAHKLSKRNPAQAKNFSEAARTVNDNVGLARDLARGLHPIELSTAGLGNALRELTYRTCHSEHLNCRFVYPRPIRIRDDAVALNFYRIAQEAVNNAIKHGKPTEVTVSLTRKRSSLVLEVSDNGCGLSGSQSGRGMGIDIMRYRANAIGGKLTVKSGDGRGTTVTCILPGK